MADEFAVNRNAEHLGVKWVEDIWCYLGLFDHRSVAPKYVYWQAEPAAAPLSVDFWGGGARDFSARPVTETRAWMGCWCV